VPWWIPVLILVAIPIELAGPMLWKARAFFVMLAVAFIGLAYVVGRLGATVWAERRDTLAPGSSSDVGNPTVAA